MPLHLLGKWVHILDASEFELHSKEDPDERIRCLEFVIVVL